MSEIKYFLNVLKKEGYPNPHVRIISNMLGYNLDYFLQDLNREIGTEGVVDFCKKAIEKMTGENGLKIDLGANQDEFVYIKIYPIDYDESENEYDVICNHAWGESRILSTDEDGKEQYMTIQEIIDQTDMGGWSELDELLDHIKGEASNKIYTNCGFGVYWL